MSEKIVHALKFRFLNGIYDSVINLTCRDVFIKNTIVNVAPIKNEDNVLDLGCGTGTLLLTLKENYKNRNINAFGADADDQILQIAKNKANKKNEKIRFIQTYAQDLPFEKNTFHIVVSSLMFHHLSTQDKKKTLKEIYRILKEDGTLILADWNKPQNIFVGVGFFFLRVLDGFKNTEIHSKGKLPEIIKQAGFSSVQVHKNINTIFGTVSIWLIQK